MDFSIYVENILSKLEDDGYYSEISKEELRHTIHNHLKIEYKKKVDEAAFDYDILEAQGQPQEREDLIDTFSEIKNDMITIVRELARTSLD